MGSVFRIISAIVCLCVITIFVSSPAISASSLRMEIERKNASWPVGHYEFCKVYAAECQRRDVKVIRMNRYVQRVINRINSDVNKAIKARTDYDMHGKEELWSYPLTEGDCEDFALMKQKRMEEEGFPSSALLMTVVTKKNGEGHSVLTVRTDAGDYVMDNFKDEVVIWSRTEYYYNKRQSVGHGGRWRNIINNELPDPNGG